MKTLADEVRGVPLGEIRAVLERCGATVETEPDALRFQAYCGPSEIRVLAPQGGSLDETPLKAVVVARTRLCDKALADDPALCARLNRFAALGAITGADGSSWAVSRLTTYEGENAWNVHGPLVAWAAICGADAFISPDVIGSDVLKDGKPADHPAWPAADFAMLEERFKGRFFCSSGERGFSVEFALRGGTGTYALGDRKTALLTMDCLERHPVLGPGLHVFLELPHCLQETQRLERLLADLNEREARPGDSVPHYGAWCPGRVGNPAYTSFIPRLLWRQGFVVNLVTWMLARARMTDAFLVMRGITAGEN